MKKIYIVMSLALGISAYGQNANVSLSNLSSNNGYSNYNTGSKVISGIFFEVLSDGDNSLNTLDDFETSLYLLACDANGSPTSNTPIVIKTYQISGMQQLHAIDYQNESVDLSTVNGLADGTYRLGVWVNSDQGIPNPPDDPNDNTGLLQSDAGTTAGSVIDFQSSGTAGIADVSESGLSISVYPNPARDVVTIVCPQLKVTGVQVYDLLGNLVAEQQTVNGTARIKVSSLESGVYFVRVGSGIQRFVKQ